jgi:hypothetical protein
MVRPLREMLIALRWNGQHFPSNALPVIHAFHDPLSSQGMMP